MDIEQQIRLQAYEIWLAAGMGEGDAERHWLQAEMALTRKSVPASKPAAAKSEVAKSASAKSASTKSAVVKKPATKAEAASLNAAKPAKAVAPRRAKAAAVQGGAEASA